MVRLKMSRPQFLSLLGTRDSTKVQSYFEQRGLGKITLHEARAYAFLQERGLDAVFELRDELCILYAEQTGIPRDHINPMEATATTYYQELLHHTARVLNRFFTSRFELFRKRADIDRSALQIPIVFRPPIELTALFMERLPLMHSAYAAARSFVNYLKAYADEKGI